MTTCACGNCQFFDHQSKAATKQAKAGGVRPLPLQSAHTRIHRPWNVAGCRQERLVLKRAPKRGSPSRPTNACGSLTRSDADHGKKRDPRGDEDNEAVNGA